MMANDDATQVLFDARWPSPSPVELDMTERANDLLGWLAALAEKLDDPTAAQAMVDGRATVEALLVALAPTAGSGQGRIPLVEALGGARELVAQTPVGELGAGITPKLSYRKKQERALSAIQAIEHAISAAAALAINGER